MKEKIIAILNFLFEYSLLALIFLLPSIFSLQALTYNVFELPKAEIFHLLVFLSFISFAGVLLIKKEIIWRFSWQIPALISAFIVFYFFSCFFSTNQELSFFGSYSRRQGFFQIIFYAVFFILLLFSLNKEKMVKKIVFAAVFSSIIPVAYGLVQLSGYDFFRWAEDFGRVFSTFGQPNFFGHYLILIIPLTTYAAVFLTNRALPKIFLIFLGVLQIVCLYGTLSRAAWVGFFSEIFFFAIFYFRKKISRKIIFSLVVSAAVFAAAVLGFSVLRKFSTDFSLAENFIERVESVFSWKVGSGSNRARLNYWSAALAIISESPAKRIFFGYGPEALSDIFTSVYKPEWALDEKIYIRPDRAHNFILDFLLQDGFFIFAIFCFSATYFLRKSLLFFRQERQSSEKKYVLIFSLAALLGYYINNLFSFSLTVNSVFSLILLSLSANVIFNFQGNKNLKIRLSGLSGILIYLFLLIFCIIFIGWRSIRVLSADHQYVLAKKAAGNSSCEALPFLERAFFLNADEIDYYEEYFYQGLVCFNNIPDKKVKEAVSDSLFDISSRIPENAKDSYIRQYEIELLSSAALLDEKFSSAAEDKFLAFKDKYPALGRVYAIWAKYLSDKGDYEGAIKILSEGLEKSFPENWQENNIFILRQKDIASEVFYFYEFLGNLHKEIGRYDEALDYYDRIIKYDPQKFLIYKRIADVYYLKKDYERALWYNKRVYSLDYKNYLWPLDIGLLYEEIGDKDKFLFYLEKSLELAPEVKSGELKKMIKSVSSE